MVSLSQLDFSVSIACYYLWVRITSKSVQFSGVSVTVSVWISQSISVHLPVVAPIALSVSACVWVVCLRLYPLQSVSVSVSACV